MRSRTEELLLSNSKKKRFEGRYEGEEEEGQR